MITNIMLLVEPPGISSKYHTSGEAAMQNLNRESIHVEHSQRPESGVIPGIPLAKESPISILTSVMLMLFLTITLSARAQTYSIDWFTIGGGGTSTGGLYSVSGTIGQPDASGAMNGGNYSVTGGFWSLFAVQAPGAPLLRIVLAGTNTAVVAWPTPATGFVLQQNSALGTTNWTDVTNTPVIAGSEKQVIVTPPLGNKFYRLKLQP